MKGLCDTLYGKLGETRIISKFLWFPVCIGNEWRWLESAIIKQSVKLIDVRQLLHLKELAVVIAAFYIFAFTKIHPAFVIIGAGVLGAIIRS